MPTSALDDLSRRQIQMPMMFQLTCNTTGLKTHVGVIEFVADEGRCFVPHWVIISNNVTSFAILGFDCLVLAGLVYSAHQFYCLVCSHHVDVVVELIRHSHAFSLMAAAGARNHVRHTSRR